MMFNINHASAALARIMEAEGSDQWEPVANCRDARIALPDGSKLYVDVNRIEEAAAEIRIEEEENEITVITPELVREYRPFDGISQQELTEIADILADQGWGGREELSADTSIVQVIRERVEWLRQQKQESGAA